MSIEIEVLNGDASWPIAKPLLDAVWPPHPAENPPWAGIVIARPELRVLVQAEPEGVVCHVGLYRREVKWNGRRIRAGGIGSLATREDARRRGYASIALNAALETLRDEGSADFALLFCEPHNAPFYVDRGWQPFEGEIHIGQPAGTMRFQALAPYVHDIRRAPRQGVLDLCGPPW